LAAAFAPSLNTVWIAPRLAAAVKNDAQCPQPEVASAGYEEASLVFLLGTSTKLVDGEGAARFLADGVCRIALVTEPEKAAFMATLAALSRQTELLDRVAGMNVGRVGKADIGVYRLRTLKSSKISLRNNERPSHFNCYSREGRGRESP
jgi:hypothetical protein